MEFIKTETISGVGLIRFNRPDKLNAFSNEFLFEIIDSLDAFAKENIKIALLTGNSNSFSAGRDLSEVIDHFDEKLISDGIRLVNNILYRISSSPVITIAVIDGYCLGLGLELATACRLRFATPNTKIGFPEKRFGFIPGNGGTQRAQEIVGSEMAEDMIFNATIFDGNEACGIGLVDLVVDSADLNQIIEERILPSENLLSLSKSKNNLHKSKTLPASLEDELQLHVKQLFAEGSKEKILTFLKR